ncbi:putative nucleoside-diphosphate-sugar epimerase [Minicystis rosea]|nr:putative nucleoside-diphosphate-sugar epimerase [Minicystis rosea]
MSVILVTGATGRHGGTGAHVARRLREEGHEVRLLVRTRGERSAALEAAGFDVRFGDLRDRASLLPALAGVDQATFCFPVDAGIVEAAASFSSALRRVSPAARVVVMSMVAAHEKSPSHLGRAQWLAEEVMAWSGLSLCVLRVAAMFYENIALLHGASIRAQGVIRNCFGAANAPWIAGEDAAELMVAALLHPERFGDEPICHPSGAALHTHAEIAEVLASELSKPIRYEPVSLDAWRDELLALAEHGDTAVNEDMARHISVLGLALSQHGATKAPDVASLERQLGRPAMSFRSFVRSHADALGA